ncbi:MAG TPA: archaeosortase/exosortase family protein [Candidatus Saccharimonadales bacterium]|nr:archaeosortase/exosortase family protein [Candidatus Saccharimonadales bacterium]
MGKDGFQIYGGAGKSLLFGTLAFLILVLKRGDHPNFKKWDLINTLWIVLAISLFITAWLGTDQLIANNANYPWMITTHLSIILLVIALMFGSFGTANLQILLKTYSKEIWLSIIMAVIFFGFLYLTYGLWRILAGIVLRCVKELLAIIGIHATYIAPRTLLFNKFGIDVEEYCSGIDSIALFTAFYALVGALDWHKLDHRRYLSIFAPALVILFGFNILRVFGLILGGYYVNPQIAFSLFHTYAGMIFFIIYTVIFWSVSYRWMLRVSPSIPSKSRVSPHGKASQ